MKLKQSAIDNVKGLNERLKLKQSALDQAKAQSQTAGKEAGSEKPWWETVLGYLGGVQDTSLPVHNTQQVAQGYREQEAAMLSPGKNWTAQQRNSFDSLLSQDRNKAREYAYTINSTLKAKQEQDQLQQIQDAATNNFGAGAAHTAGAILSAPFGMADYLGDVIAQGTLGYIPKSDGQVTPFEYSQAVTGGVSQNLNDKFGTLSEKIPVIGGKGLGDVYGLGTSIAQSSLAAFTGGSGQALIQFFGSSAASGVDDALNRGASGDQAVAYGTMLGLAEGLAEMIGVDNLMKIGSASTLRQFVGNLLKQGAAEGLEEGITAVLNNFADNLVMGSKSNFHSLVAQYMAAGMGEEAAKRKAWASMAEGVAFDMLGGFVSGSVHAAPQTAYQTYQQNQANAKQNAPAQQSQQPSTLIEDIADRIMSKPGNSPTEAQQAPQQPKQINIAEIMDEVIAKANGAPADPVGAAVEAFKSTGTVTNKQATDILNSVKAVTRIIEETGVKFPDTASGRRAAVKQAIADLAQRSIAQDNAANTEVAEKDAAQTSGIQYQLVEYSQHQKDNWKNSKRIVLYDGIEHFKQFIKNALSGSTQTNKKMYFGSIPTDLANAIASATGVNVAGYNLSLAENEVRKIHKSHGSEKNEAPRGQRAVTEADYLNIPNVVQSPDSITLSPKMYEGKPVIVFRKASNGETSVVAAVVSDKRLDLFVQTTFVNKKTGSIATPEPVQADSFTPKATGGTAPFDASLDGVGRGANNRIPHDVSSDASKNSISQSDPNVNPSPDESVGTAPSGFGPISHLRYEYGTLPEGENPVRPDDLPVSTDGKDRVSQTAVTVKGAKVTPDEFVDLLHKEVAEGGLSYIPITNNATVQRAMDHISKVGWEEARKAWSADVYRGKTGADMSAVGALLLNNAANAGDKAAWREILHDYQTMGTNTAQGLQALRILKKLEPTDKLYMIERSVQQMCDDMQVDVELDEALLHEFENAKTDEARDAAMDKIQQSVADQLPSTLMEKWTALRYVNMLGNLRTQVRNVAGNFGMKLVASTKNTLAALMENAAHSLSGGKIEKTKSLTVSRAQLEAAKADFDQFKSLVLGGGKYADSRTASEEFAQGVMDKRTIFKFKPLEGYRKVTARAMEKGDVIFSRTAYARALAGYLKAQGVTETDYTKVDTALMDKARLYAAQEAQEQTFRDTNWLSGWVSKIGRRKDTPAAGKLLSEGIMPFRKTPANVLIRAEEYSPLGIINSVYYSVKAAQSGSDVTAAQVINSWAKTLTGTGIFALGMLLNNLGVLAGGPDEDEGKEDFESLNGWQNYALILPDGTNITIDWLTPAAMPLLMGAQLMELIHDGGFQLKDLEKALLSIADPMVEMSMLQGINDTLENIRYADGNNLGQLAANAALSYLTQGLTNTLFGQLERTFEDSRMTTFVDKDSGIPDWLQRAIGKAFAKTPVLDYNQIPYINAWGEEEENPEWWLNGLYNTLSPGYIEKGVTDGLTQELNRLNEAQSDTNVYPSTPDKTITIDKKKRNLSAEEYVALAKTQGQTAKRTVEDIISSEYYAGLSDQQKAKAISYAYDYAREHARVETLEDYTEYSAKWMKGLDGDAAETILRKVAAGTTEKYTDLPIDQAAYVDEILTALKNAPRETKPDGSLYAEVRYVQQVEAITSSKLTEAQQTQIMDEVLDDPAYAKYLKILDQGYSNDDYAAALRIYLDAEKTETRTKKQVIIQEFMDDLDLTKSEAEALYKLYNGAK